MNRPGRWTNGILLAQMVCAAALGYWFTPTQLLADQQSPLNLKAVVPASFGDWHELSVATAQIIDPSAQKLINTIYTETLSRTYVNSAGYRIMLSMAYGKDQRESLQLHQPEVCYPAQGFEVLSRQRTSLSLPQRNIAATQLQTQLGSRKEPVTYWTMIGEEVYQGGIPKKLAEMRYAAKGQIPDGMLFRISSIDADTPRAYQQHQQFADALIQAMSPSVINRFAGKPGL